MNNIYKTRLIELSKNFKTNFITFFSIVLFVAAGLAAFLGLDWSKESIADSFCKYFNEGNLHEMEFSYALGLNNDDISYLKKMKDVDEVEGRYETFRFVKSNGIKEQIHIYSITNRINKFTYLDGRMPKGDSEILVEKSYAKSNSINIGDTIKFQKDDPASYLLKNNKFKVSGIVKTPEYTSIHSDTYGVNPTNGCTVKGIMFTNKSAFQIKLLPGFSAALLKCGGLGEVPMLTDEYDTAANDLSTDLRKDLEDRFTKKYISLTAKSANPSYVSAKTIADIFVKLRIPLAGLFVIVGMLVCFFTVSRNVYDQSKLIGMKKALGFYKREITFSYLIFSLLSTLIGSVIGALIARYGIEWVLDRAIQQEYPFNDTVYVFNMNSAALFAVFEISVILLSTYFATISVLKRSAHNLLSGGNEYTFGEKLYMKNGAYRRMSVLGKTILNNLFSEKRRALSTVVGVMGISALVVCSFSLNNFIQGSFDKQNKEITSYDTVLNVEQNDKDIKKIESYLESKGLAYCDIMSTYVTITTPDNQNIVTSIYVVDDDTKFLKLFTLRDGETRANKLQGLYSSASYGKEYSASPGDKMSITDAKGQKHKIKTAGFFDYYLIQNQLVIDKDTFEKEFDDDFKVNSMILNRGDYDVESLCEELTDYNGFINADDFYKISKESFDGFSAVFKLVLAVYILMAIMMAFVVIMNLLDMFIKEKKYELTVLMINGFKTRQAKSYIYTDTIILSALGTILGVVLGIIMGNASLDAYRTASINFKGGINIEAVLVGIGLTVTLVFIVAVINIKKIDKFRLGDINAQ